MKCEKCNLAEGVPYQFTFGKKLGEERAGPLAQQTIITGYAVGGSKETALCDKCVFNYRMRRLGNTLMVALAGVLLVLGGGPPIKFTGTITPTVLQAAGLVLVPMCLLYLLAVVVVRSKQAMGEDLAISLSKEELEKEGYDKFWGAEELKSLKGNG